MVISKYIGFFLFSMIKFLFTPFGGPDLGLSYWETYFSCVSGALLSSLIFYFSAEFFLNKAKKKRQNLYKEAQQKGIEIKQKKIFTRGNKFIVKMKRSMGIFGIGMYAPLFLSIPLGSIIAAKFYGKDRRTFPVIVFGIILNGFITTGLAFLLR